MYFIHTFLTYRQNAEQRIHPESEENVQNVREEIQQQRHVHQSSSANGTTASEDQSTPRQPMRVNYGDQQCPVCLSDAQFGVQTNCGHLFCGKEVFFVTILLLM